MIEIRNLVKIYSHNKSKQCVALNGVTFALPDKGMVFIVGKSGSGKSTLLNMIGGLDRLTSGDIIVDGQSFADFKQSDYDNYHCNYLGFVFQDFCLIDTLTIKENIALSLKLQGSADMAKVDEVLSRLDMDEYAQRFPSELSGGQKQRVAIARALIKSPKLILADEPTGNLDSKTGKQILEILKEISINNLVVVVSHSATDADEYADRIIELADGQVVKDVVRSDKETGVVISEKEISFNKGTIFTDEQIRQINQVIKSNNGVTVKQTDSKFTPTDKSENATSLTRVADFNVKSKSFCGKDFFKIFTKKRIINQVITTLLVACLIIVLGVCQLFTQFNADEQIADILKQTGDNALVLKKGYPSKDIYKQTLTDKFVRINDDDINAFKNGGYKGEIYKLYNAPLITGSGHACLTEQSLSISTVDNCREFYSYESRGVLVCDEHFLTDLYGIDGQLDYVGQFDTTGNGLILTDYLADSILFFNNRLISHGSNYDTLLNGDRLMSRFKVCAIINTNYRERYKDLIDIYVSMNDGDQIGKQELMSNELYAQFLSELDYSLNIAYSFNPNYGEELKIADTVEDKTHRTFARTLITEVYDENDRNLITLYGGIIYQDMNLADDAILISKSYYAEILGIDEDLVDDSVIGNKLSFEMYDNGNDADIILSLQDMRIVGFSNSCVYMSTNNFKKFISLDQFAYALYFDNPDFAMTAYAVGQDNCFVCSSQLFNSVYTVAQAVSIFTDLFGLVVVILCALSVVLLISFILGGIKKNAYEIGVLRALGASNGNIAVAYLLQAILMGVIIALVAVLGLALGAEFCNGLLADGFVQFTGNPNIRQIKIIKTDFSTIAIDVAVTLVLAGITGVAPFIVLRRIKPTEIIRSKE